MSDAVKKILVIQLKQIGDVLLTTPAVEVLARNFPGAKIDFLTQKPCDEVLRENPFIHKVLVYERESPLKWLWKTRKAKYDMVVDFLSNPRSALLTAASGAKIKAGPAYTHSARAYNVKLSKPGNSNSYAAFLKIDLLKSIGIREIFYPYPKIFISDEDRLWALGELRRLSVPDNALVIGLAPFSRRITRQWPPEHYARLADMAGEKHPLLHIVIFWGPGEKETANKIKKLSSNPNLQVSPRMPTLSKLGAMLEKCAMAVSNCNGPKHIAQAAGIPTLGIYASSSPSAWNPPQDPRHRHVRLESLDCVGCGKNKCPLKAAPLQCLRELKPETVFLKFEKMLKHVPDYEPAKFSK